MSAQLSDFARSLSVETAFTVLALARSLKAAGKHVVELEIGDSPFDKAPHRVFAATDRELRVTAVRRHKATAR